MPEEIDNASGMSLVIGKIEDALAMVGRKLERPAEFEVNSPMIEYFCSMVEDANASYWDDSFARQQWGGRLSPPSMLQSWGIPLTWRPGGAREFRSLVADLPLPGDKPINLSSDAEYFEPVLVGDRLRYVDEIASISAEKRTKLGVGHFIELVTHIYNQHDVCVARITNLAYRYRSDPENK